jgi:hypothetical protein
MGFHDLGGRCRGAFHQRIAEKLAARGRCQQRLDSRCLPDRFRQFQAGDLLRGAVHLGHSSSSTRVIAGEIRARH